MVAVVGVEPALRIPRGAGLPVLLWLVMALGRPLCLLSQLFMPLASVHAPLPLGDAAALETHRVRLR